MLAGAGVPVGAGAGTAGTAAGAGAPVGAGAIPVTAGAAAGTAIIPGPTIAADAAIMGAGASMGKARATARTRAVDPCEATAGEAMPDTQAIQDIPVAGPMPMLPPGIAHTDPVGVREATRGMPADPEVDGVIREHPDPIAETAAAPIQAEAAAVQTGPIPPEGHIIADRGPTEVPPPEAGADPTEVPDLPEVAEVHTADPGDPHGPQEASGAVAAEVVPLEDSEAVAAEVGLQVEADGLAEVAEVVADADKL